MSSTMAERFRKEFAEFALRRAMAGSTMAEVLETTLPKINDPSKPISNHGTPPFLVLADMVPMGVIDAEGDFFPCPFGYEPDTDVIDQDRFDTVFSTLGFGGAILSAMPVHEDFRPPSPDSVDAFDRKFYEMPEALWEAAGVASGEISKLLEQRLAGSLFRKVAGLHGRFSQLAEQGEVELPEDFSADVMLVQMLADGNTQLRLVIASYKEILEELEKELEKQEEDSDDDEADDD